MRRRKFIATGLATASIGLAGCPGGGGSEGEESAQQTDDTTGESGDAGNETETTTETPTGPAEFTNVQLRGADSVVAGEETPVTLAVRNTGGEPGVFTDSVAVIEGPQEFSASVETDDVGPGEQATVELGPVTFENADDYVLTAEEADAELSFTVGPARARVGQSHDIGDLRVTVDGVDFRPSVLHAEYNDIVESDQIDAFGAPSGRILALVELTVENIGTEAANLGETLGVADGALYDEDAVPLSDLLAPSGEAFPPGGTPTVEPSQTVEGYYLAQVSREAARGTARITVQSDATGTPPERVWEVPPESGDTRALPQFTVDVDAPSATDVGRDFETTITITNEGDGDGTFRGALQRDGGDGEDWLSVGDGARLSSDVPADGAVVEDVPAGESTAVTVADSAPVLNTYDYRLVPTGSTWEIEFQPAELTVGEPFKSFSYTVTVADPQTFDQLEYLAEDAFGSENRTTSGRSGYNFIAFRLRYAARPERADGNNYFSDIEEDFDILAGDSEVGVFEGAEDDGNNFSIDSRPNYPSIPGEGYFFEDDDEVSGWVVRQVPDQYNVTDLRVRYQIDSVEAYWSEQ